MTALRLFPASGNEEVLDCLQHLQRHGCLVLVGALPGPLCAELGALVDSCLAGQPEDEDLGEVRCREKRWDLKLFLVPPAVEALQTLCSGLAGALIRELLSPRACLAELSCLVTDPGAEQQPLHTDTERDSDGTPLYTVFVALQDITINMGPTNVCPGTHTQHVLSYIPGPAVQMWPRTPVTLDRGSALIMDSRLLHCGGANTGSRRRLLYCTWAAPGCSPSGSTYTIRSELRGNWFLQDFVMKRFRT